MILCDFWRVDAHDHDSNSAVTYLHHWHAEAKADAERLFDLGYETSVSLQVNDTVLDEETVKTLLALQWPVAPIDELIATAQQMRYGGASVPSPAHADRQRTLQRTHQ